MLLFCAKNKRLPVSHAASLTKYNWSIAALTFAKQWESVTDDIILLRSSI